MENEQQNIEYKRIWKDDVLKEISGFANAQGGKVYIGIDDDHTIVGVPKIKEQLEDIPNKIVTLLGIVPEVNHVVMDGKDVVEIIVSTSNIPIPYRGVYYQRSGATKQELCPS